MMNNFAYVRRDRYIERRSVIKKEISLNECPTERLDCYDEQGNFIYSALENKTKPVEVEEIGFYSLCEDYDIMGKLAGARWEKHFDRYYVPSVKIWEDIFCGFRCVGMTCPSYGELKEDYLKSEYAVHEIPYKEGDNLLLVASWVRDKYERPKYDTLVSNAFKSVMEKFK